MTDSRSQPSEGPPTSAAGLDARDASFEPRSVDEIVASLHHEGRSPRRQRSAARARWFAELPVPDKADALGELEVLIEGVATLPRALGPADAEDDRAEVLQQVLAALQRISARAAHLLRQPRRRRSGALSVPGEADAVARLPRPEATPEEVLRSLAHAIDGFVAIAGVMGSGPVPARALHALVGAIAREVARTPYFDPLHPLVVQEELDHLHGAGPRAAAEHLASNAGRRVAARAFLLLDRCRRMLALARRYGAEGTLGTLGPIVLAAFRHRTRGVAAYLEDRAGDALADGFERELMSVPLRRLPGLAEPLEARARDLVRLRAALEGVAVALRLETRPRQDDPAAEVERLRLAIDALETRLERAIVGPAAPRLDGEAAARRDARVRRDAWMFAQVLRAFLAKADAFRGGADSWSGLSGGRFVADFLQHFRALGQPLVAETDFREAAALREALETLRETDLLDAERMARAAAVCGRFRDHLRGTFDALSSAPFDRQEAAATLRAYLVA